MTDPCSCGVKHPVESLREAHENRPARRAVSTPISDVTVAQGGPDALVFMVSTAIEALQGDGSEPIDWTTIDLRIFRDVRPRGDVLDRDAFLTIRASALVKP